MVDAVSAMAGFMREARTLSAGRGRDAALPRDQRRPRDARRRAATRSTPRWPRTSCSASSCRTSAATAATCSRSSGTASLHGYIGAGRAPQRRDGRRASASATTNASARWATCRRSVRTRSRFRARRAAGSTCSSGGGAGRSASSRQPALRYAEDGFPLTRRGAGYLHRVAAPRTTTSGCPTSATAYPRTEPGDWIRQPALARTIRALADDGPGRVLQGCDRRRDRRRKLQAHGSFMAADDLAAHEGAWVDPLRARRSRTSRSRELPPPTQGVTALEALRIVDGFDLADRRRRPRAPARSRR